MNFEFRKSLSEGVNKAKGILKNGLQAGKNGISAVKESVQTGLCRLHMGLGVIAQKGYDAALKELDDAPSENEVCSDECSECIKESQCLSSGSNLSKASISSKVYEIEPELVKMVDKMEKEITLEHEMSAN